MTKEELPSASLPELLVSSTFFFTSRDRFLAFFFSFSFSSSAARFSSAFFFSCEAACAMLLQPQLIHTGGKRERRDGEPSQSVLFNLYILLIVFLLFLAGRPSEDQLLQVCEEENMSHLFVELLFSLCSCPHCAEATIQFGAGQGHRMLLSQSGKIIKSTKKKKKERNLF